MRRMYIPIFRSIALAALIALAAAQSGCIAVSAKRCCCPHCRQCVNADAKQPTSAEICVEIED